MSQETWTLIFTAVSAIGTCAAAIFAAVSAKGSRQAVEEMRLSRKQQEAPKVERLEAEMILRVPFCCIEKDAEGFWIPGYGKLLITDEQYAAIKKHEREYCECRKTTALADPVHCYEMGRRTR